MSTIKNKIFPSFSDALSSALAYNGIKPVEIAKEIKKDRSQVSKWLSGAHNPRPATRRLLMNVSGIEIEELGEGQYQIASGLNDKAKIHEPKVPYAAQVELPKDHELSRDDLQKLLEQIELLARLVRNNLK